MIVCVWQMLKVGIILYRGYGENGEVMRVIGQIGIVLGLFLFLALWFAAGFLDSLCIQAGKYEVLEGNADWSDTYHTSYVNKGREEERIHNCTSIRNFISIYGESSKWISTIVPKRARIFQLINTEVPQVPVLLIRVRGKVREVVPDWERISRDERYCYFTPRHRDLMY